MIVELDLPAALPERVKSFLNESEIFLFKKDETHLTIANWGVELPEIEPDKVRESIKFLDEFYFVKKHYKKQPPYVLVDHVRASVIWAVSNPYLQEFYNANPEHSRFLHVTTHVGVVIDRGCDSWKHGIGIQGLDDIGLITEKILDNRDR